MDLVIGEERPIAVRSGDGGRLVGVVTKDALLRGIRGET